ncbi:uncharacterized protein H6S33_007997 [Morchella sextelata]|uniref:uncharacterized protein n=1 Tax=Morchella sextelata TaxID=1174677 RepID=UPI001D03A231|nr:uncharacterized protein H6S33_007997 [Morchella sextelata]KAH0602993.1 hypothetical protein H6S33_007997 [Morchella sextelata]
MHTFTKTLSVLLFLLSIMTFSVSAADTLEKHTAELEERNPVPGREDVIKGVTGAVPDVVEKIGAGGKVHVEVGLGMMVGVAAVVVAWL